MDCGCATARKLLSSPQCPLLAALGSHLQFELAVGQNGRVWVSAKTAAHTVLVAMAIRNTELVHYSKAQAEIAVKSMVEHSLKPAS